MVPEVTESTELLSLVRAAAVAADDKKALDTIIIDVGEVLSVSDFFVITSGSTARQVGAIVDSVEAGVKAIGGPGPVRVEGLDQREWVLLDYGAFVVHVFAQAQRDFYQLERLWSDRPRVEWDPQLPSVVKRQ